MKKFLFLVHSVLKANLERNLICAAVGVIIVAIFFLPFLVNKGFYGYSIVTISSVYAIATILTSLAASQEFKYKPGLIVGYSIAFTIGSVVPVAFFLGAKFALVVTWLSLVCCFLGAFISHGVDGVCALCRNACKGLGNCFWKLIGWLLFLIHLRHIRK